MSSHCCTAMHAGPSRPPSCTPSFAAHLLLHRPAQHNSAPAQPFLSSLQLYRVQNEHVRSVTNTSPPVEAQDASHQLEAQLVSANFELPACLPALPRLAYVGAAVHVDEGAGPPRKSSRIPHLCGCRGGRRGMCVCRRGCREQDCHCSGRERVRWPFQGELITQEQCGSPQTLFITSVRRFSHSVLASPMLQKHCAVPGEPCLKPITYKRARSDVKRSYRSILWPVGRDLWMNLQYFALSVVPIYIIWYEGALLMGTHCTVYYTLCYVQTINPFEFCAN